MSFNICYCTCDTFCEKFSCNIYSNIVSICKCYKYGKHYKLITMFHNANLVVTSFNHEVEFYDAIFNLIKSSINYDIYD